MNPFQMLQMFKGGSPKNIVMNMVKNTMGSNPMVKNLIDMAEKGDNKRVENFARNIMKEKGMDFDKEFNTFMNNMSPK